MLRGLDDPYLRQPVLEPCHRSSHGKVNPALLQHWGKAMLIDWFTVGAQTLNFLILVWLMKRFLYKPILHAIDEREKRIAAELASADRKKDEAEKQINELKQKNEELDQQRTTILKKATDEAKIEGQKLLDEARKAADTLSVKRMESLRSDAVDLTSGDQSIHPA